MGKAKERSIMDYLFHVGNAGVILKLGGQWVGIDVFTGREIKPYQPLPETLEQKLLCDAGCPEIGLLVVTHSHRDHFHPQKVSAYLKTCFSIRGRNCLFRGMQSPITGCTAICGSTAGK